MSSLPIGAGQAKRPRVSRTANNDADEHDAEPEPTPAAPLAAVPAAPAPVAEVDAQPEVLWEPRRLERPLQVVVGKSVNLAMKKRTGLETTKAGLMSQEHAEAIAEPLCEVLNGTPLRALAEKQTEIALGVAIYDYVQEAVHTAGRDVALAELELQRHDLARRHAGDAPPLVIDDEGEVPDV